MSCEVEVPAVFFHLPLGRRGCWNHLRPADVGFRGAAKVSKRRELQRFHRAPDGGAWKGMRAKQNCTWQQAAQLKKKASVCLSLSLFFLSLSLSLSLSFSVCFSVSLSPASLARSLSLSLSLSLALSLSLC